MSTKRQTLGLVGERQAERFLVRRGLRTIARRYATPVGEIDLIMRDRDTIVFVEVKARCDRRLADPQDAVNHTKRQHMTRAARWFLKHKNWHDCPCRFDVVGVVIPPDPRPAWRRFLPIGRPRPEIAHVEAAFEPQ